MWIVRGNLWDEWVMGRKVVITTNIGWDPKTLRNNMGAGIAWDAAQRWPELPQWYGRFCRATYPHTPVLEHPYLRLIFFPVKPLLNRNNPEISWNQQASLPLIDHGMRQLVEHEGHIAMGLPGCGNGGLDQSAVAAVLSHWIRGARSERIRVVDRAWGAPPPERVFIDGQTEPVH